MFIRYTESVWCRRLLICECAFPFCFEGGIWLYWFLSIDFLCYFWKKLYLFDLCPKIVIVSPKVFIILVFIIVTPHAFVVFPYKLLSTALLCEALSSTNFRNFLWKFERSITFFEISNILPKIFFDTTLQAIDYILFAHRSVNKFLSSYRILFAWRSRLWGVWIK